MTESVTITSEQTGPNAPGEEGLEVAPNVMDMDAEATAVDRPDWLPEKFDSPEAMAEAYGNLESKFSQDTAKAVAEGDALTTEAIMTASAEYAQNGALSENMMDALVGKPITQEVVDMVMDQLSSGQKALAENAAGQIMAEVGGAESYQELVAWATENLSEEEITTFNAQVESDDINVIRLAVQNLHLRRGQVAPTNTPKLRQGTTAPTSSNAYQSVAQLTEAMKDPRYGKDPAYRQEVLDRMRVSNIM